MDLASFGDPPEDLSKALALPQSVQPFLGTKLREVGVLNLEVIDIGLEERLGLGVDLKIGRMFAEVEERVNRRVFRLKAELRKREAELEKERRGRERLKSQKQEVEERAAYLSRQVSAAGELQITGAEIKTFFFYQYADYLITKQYKCQKGSENYVIKKCRNSM